MPSKVAICNMAIGHLGSAKEINDFDTDKTVEAAACRRYYDLCRDLLLSEFWWPFSRNFVTLALVEENPTDEWKFSYGYPNDCLFVRRILSGLRRDNSLSRVPFRVVGQLIYTDFEIAQIEYTKKEEDPTNYPAGFVSALSYLLASKIGPQIVQSDPGKLVQLAAGMYPKEAMKAGARAANEEGQDQEPDDYLVLSRG